MELIDDMVGIGGFCSESEDMPDHLYDLYRLSRQGCCDVYRAALNSLVLPASTKYPPPASIQRSVCVRKTSRIEADNLLNSTRDGR